MVNKLLLFLLLSFGFLTAEAQTSNYWITNPSIKGKLSFQNGWVLYDTTSGIKINGDIWVGGSSIFLGGTQIQDSSGFIIFNKAIKTRPSIGDTEIDPWITNEMLADTSITGSKIKKNSITTVQMAPTLRDSIFGSKTTGAIDLNLTTLKSRVDRLFDSKGNFKTTVFGNTLTYDSNTFTVKLDTGYYLKSRDSLRYLSGGTDTSRLLHKYDSLRFTSGTTFLPRSDTVNFLKFADTVNFLKKADSTRYWTRTQFDTTEYWSFSRMDSNKYWTKARLDTNQYISINDIDTTKLVYVNDIDSSQLWSRLSYDPSKFWQFKNKDTNKYFSTRNLDTSKLWNTGKNPVSSYWNTTTFDTTNYWSFKRKDTSRYYTIYNLDTSKLWDTVNFSPTKFITNSTALQSRGVPYLDTTTLIKRNQTDVYWSRIDPSTKLDTAKLTHTADSSYWRKTNLDTTKFISFSDINTSIFTNNSGQLTIPDFGLDPKKIDTSKIGVGLKYNGTKLGLSRTDTNYTRIKDNDVIPKVTMTFKWSCYFTATTAGLDLHLTRSPDSTFAYEDTYGYGMPAYGRIEFISYDNHDDGTTMLFTNNNISFTNADFLNLKYEGSGNSLWLEKNGVPIGTGMAIFPADYVISTYTIGVVFDIY
jgi:hypothetical protein